MKFLAFVSAPVFSLLIAGCASPPPQPVEARPVGGSQELQESRRLMNACQLTATSGALRAVLPAAMLGDERAFRAVSAEKANLLLSTAAISNQSPLITSAERNAEIFLARKEVVLKANRALQLLRQQSSQALEASENVFSAELADEAAVTRLSAASALVMLTQRIGKSSAEFLTLSGLDPEAVFLIGKDTKVFQELLTALIEGNSELRIKPARTAASKQRLASLSKAFASMKIQVDIVLSDLQNLASAREAQAKLQLDLAALGDITWKACSGAR